MLATILPTSHHLISTITLDWMCLCTVHRHMERVVDYSTTYMEVQCLQPTCLCQQQQQQLLLQLLLRQ